MNSAAFSWNLLVDLQTMWRYDFMRHAFEAGTLVAIVAGVIGFFTCCVGRLSRRMPLRTSALRARRGPFSSESTR